MPDRAAMPPKDLSAGLVLVHRENGKFRVLCLRTYDAWDFPKRPVTPDEDPLEAAIAHARESMAIEPPDFPWGEDYRETVPFEDGRVSRYYLAESPSADIDLLAPAVAGAEEDYELRWVTVDEAEDLLPPRLALILDWAVVKLSRPRAH